IKNYWGELPAGGFSEREINRVRHEMALRFNMRFATSARIANELVRLRNLDWPLSSVDQYGEHLVSISKDEIARAFAACHGSTVLSIVGDDETIQHALTASHWR